MSVAPSTYRFFAVTSPGLEALLREELGELGIVGKTTPGGVNFTGTLETLWNAAARSRLAESIRVRLKPFGASSFSELEQGLSRLPWHAYLHPHEPVDVRVNCSASKLYHTKAVEERLRVGLALKWRDRAPDSESVTSDEAPAKLFVRIVRDEVSVSVDATGLRLHRRGYRTHVGTAPLRETLAAAACRILSSAAPDRDIRQVWDPCCGSATLLCEWLLLAKGIAPATATGQMRRFRFESWPIHPLPEFEAWKHRLLASEPDLTAPWIHSVIGSDLDARVLAAAKTNLEQARLSERGTLIHADFREAAVQVPPRAAVVSNLPYGVRLTGKVDAASTFAQLDKLLRKRGDLRPAVVISTELPRQVPDTPWRPAVRFANGGLAVTAWLLT